MAVFQHNNRSINYSFQFAPFHEDLVLLHPSKFTSEFWAPVLKELSVLPPSKGRILTCEWFETGLSDSELAETLAQLVTTLGLEPCAVMACGDAADVAGEAERLRPGTFNHEFFYQQKVPSSADLALAIRDFFQV